MDKDPIVISKLKRAKDEAEVLGWKSPKDCVLLKEEAEPWFVFGEYPEVHGMRIHVAEDEDQRQAMVANMSANGHVVATTIGVWGKAKNGDGRPPISGVIGAWVATPAKYPEHPFAILVGDEDFPYATPISEPITLENNTETKQ